MIILIIVVVLLLLLIWGGYELSLLIEYGSAPKDSDLLEMLDKYGSDDNVINKNWDDCYYISSGKSYKLKDIWKSKAGIIFPYYFPSVGVIPIWYKSAGQIDIIFKELKKNSKFENNKRKSLGLD